jgi:hypothetical protein
MIMNSCFILGDIDNADNVIPFGDTASSAAVKIG